MKWTEVWMKLFGTTEWLGVDIGFWVSMGAVTLLVVLMNIVFWCMKPKQTDETADASAKEKPLF